MATLWWLLWFVIPFVLFLKSKTMVNLKGNASIRLKKILNKMLNIHPAIPVFITCNKHAQKHTYKQTHACANKLSPSQDTKDNNKRPKRANDIHTHMHACTHKHTHTPAPAHQSLRDLTCITLGIYGSFWYHAHFRSLYCISRWTGFKQHLVIWCVCHSHVIAMTMHAAHIYCNIRHEISPQAGRCVSIKTSRHTKDRFNSYLMLLTFLL